MNHLSILPGNSKRNQAWAEACASHFASQFDEIHIQLYQHWKVDEQSIDIEKELSLLKVHNASLKEGTNVVMFAKSVGSLLALKGVAHNSIQPVACVFFGMPLDLAVNDIFQHDLSPLTNFSIPAIAFHNKNDPTANYEYTKTLLEDTKSSISVHPCTGDTHDYLDFSQYDSVIDTFLNKFLKI